MAGYLVSAFVLMKFEKFDFVHKNLYYFGHWALPLSCFLATVLPRVRRDKTTSKTETSRSSQ